jgi:hypothetical protein
MTHKYEASLVPKWRLVTYHTLATNYDELDQRREAIQYYMLSAALDPKAYYYIQSAIQYTKLNEIHMADRMIVLIAEKDLVLTKTDVGLLTELKELLKQSRQHGANEKGALRERP